MRNKMNNYLCIICNTHMLVMKLQQSHIGEKMRNKMNIDKINNFRHPGTPKHPLEQTLFIDNLLSHSI